MNDMRREFLKAYVFALMTEGILDLRGSVGDNFKKALQTIGLDFPAVCGDLAEQYAMSSGRTITAALLGKMNKIVRDIDKRGFGAVWKDVQEVYKRGVEANTRKRG